MRNEKAGDEESDGTSVVNERSQTVTDCHAMQ